MFSKNIRTRLTILFFALLSLTAASLDLANACFAATLRDRARSNYNTNGIVDDTFQKFQNNVFGGMVAAVVLTTACTIYGFVIAVHPRWLESRQKLELSDCLQFFLAILMVGTGTYLAIEIHSFQTSFERFASNDSIPYYSIMYYGGLGQVVYGVVLAVRTFVLEVMKPENSLFRRFVAALY
ncbi:hypothetical protein BR93DRAFT_956583 [Coniochaeta sp. PMI_546]|nr:hypothetical protein BR93DRAFT_956583 [Coniochaeta sp. PMI_546]